MRERAHRIVLAAVLTAVAVTALAAGRRFYDDDPIARVPESQNAANAKPLGIDLFFEYAYNLFVTAKRTPSNTRAGDLNTIDEVPDSSWFTNRIGVTPVSVDAITRGPNAGAPPAPANWTLVREKSAGTNPGFTAVDAAGQTWFLQFDAPPFPEAQSGAVAVVTRLFWALGYNMVETYVTTFDRKRARIGPEATFRRPNGKRTPFTEEDVSSILDRAVKSPAGPYRASAGRLIPGKVLGSFRYQGTRSDDPNDLVPHENRRVLRAIRVFGAWVNLVDWKAGNTLDALEDVDGRSIVRHYLQDVGSSLGMANNEHEWDMGWEHYYDADATMKRLLTFGFALSPWQTAPYDELPSVHRFEGDEFDPTTWKPQTPVAAYVEMRDDDAFWAARRVMAFSDDLIRAAVHTGEYSDPAAETLLTSVLIKRRNAIGRAYLPAINPIVNPRLTAGGSLTFENAAAAYGFANEPDGYRAEWFHFDNTAGVGGSIGRTESTSRSMTAPAGIPTERGAFVEVDLSAQSAAHPTWSRPVKTYFRRTADGWKLVGLERLP
jgi:hypothetical protein